MDELPLDVLDWSGYPEGQITKPHPPKEHEIAFHIDFADWTRSDNKISVGFTICTHDDGPFIVRLTVLGDTEEDSAVCQLGELAGGEAWHRIRRVIGPQIPSGSRLERGELHGVLPNVQYIVEMDPRGLALHPLGSSASGGGGLTILPTVYKIVDKEPTP